MEFRLKYEGPLKAKGYAKHKHSLRKAFHPQLRELWKQQPLARVKGDLLNPSHKHSVIKPVGSFRFASLISSRIDLLGVLDILMLTPGEPNSIISSGDIDNRLKTLLDSLKCPTHVQDIPAGEVPSADESPFYCLFEDDNLITSIKVSRDRLLESEDDSDVFLLIHVKTLPSLGTPIALSIP